MLSAIFVFYSPWTSVQNQIWMQVQLSSSSDTLRNVSSYTWFFMDVCFQEASMWVGLTCAHSIPAFFLTVHHCAQMKFRKRCPPPDWLNEFLTALQQQEEAIRRPHKTHTFDGPIRETVVIFRLPVSWKKWMNSQGWIPTPVPRVVSHTLAPASVEAKGQNSRLILSCLKGDVTPTCEIPSRVQVSHGPDGEGGCWKGFKSGVSVKHAPQRKETGKGPSRKQVAEEEGSKRDDISGPSEVMWLPPPPAPSS